MRLGALWLTFCPNVPKGESILSVTVRRPVTVKAIVTASLKDSLVNSLLDCS